MMRPQLSGAFARGAGMLTKINALLHKRPYLSAIVAGAIWNSFWGRENLLAVGSSAFVVGLCVGLFGITRWQGLFTKLPAALGCFALVALCVDIAGRALGQREANMYSLLILIMSVYSSPLVLVGELLGWTGKALYSGIAVKKGQ